MNLSHLNTLFFLSALTSPLESAYHSPLTFSTSQSSVKTHRFGAIIKCRHNACRRYICGKCRCPKKANSIEEIRKGCHK